MTTMSAVPVLAFLGTYLIHSTVLLGAACLLARHVARTEAWRETLWKAALIGSVLTSTAAQATPWTPLLLTLPVTAFEPVEPASAETARRSPARGDAESEAMPVTEMRQTDAALAGASQRVVPSVRAEQSARDAGGSASVTPSVGGGSEAAAGFTHWPTSFVAAWFAITLLLLVRLAWRHVQLARLLRHRSVVTDADALSLLAELRRMSGVWVPIQLTSTTALASPLVLGRREICVPERFLTELGRDEQRAALAHELGHLARRDPAWLLGAMLLECVFFFQPLQRVARQRLRETAEYRADGWAVRIAGGRLSLARCLAEVATWVAPSPQPAMAERVAMAEGGSPLLSRVSRLLERQPEAEPRALLRLAGGIALVAAAAVLAPGIGTASGQPPTVAPELLQPLDAGGEITTQDTLTVLRFDGPALEGSSFVARLNAAERDARQVPHWIAYAITTRAGETGQVIDSDSWDTRDVQGAGVAQRLGIADEVTANQVVVLARLVPNGASTRVARLAVRSPRVGAALSGRVYWLGSADAEESFRWLRDIYTAVDDHDIRETAVDMIALHPTPSAAAFLRRVIDTADDARLREEAVEGLVHHPGDDVLALLLHLGESDADHAIAREAAESLGELDHSGAGAALRTLIRDAAAEVREEALESLIERGDTSLAALLLELALTDRDESMRREAVEAMAHLPPAVAVPLLRRVAFESAWSGTIAQAVETLGEVGTGEALDVLEDVIARSTSQDVVLEAVESMAESGAERAPSVLEQLANSHPSTQVRREAMEQLLDLGSGVVDQEALLEMALHDDEPDMRREAVEWIAELPAERAVPLLRRVAFESGDGTAERQAAESLGDVGTEEALAVLDDIIARNPGEGVSLQAVESIAEKYPRAAAIPRLTRISQDHPSARVRREALDRLRDLEGDR